MAQISIKNIGPIKEASFNLKQVNLFIGPQGAGKSTILKILSHCLWYEKHYWLTSNKEFNDTKSFIESLCDFHHINKESITDTSEINFNGDYVIIQASRKDFKISKKNDEVKYSRCKISYIPAERSFIFSVPNIERYKSNKNDNTQNYVFEWIEARKHYSYKEFKIPLLSASYVYSKNLNKDVLILKEKGNSQSILLDESSSGYQTSIPLFILIDYLTNKIHTINVVDSYQEKLFVSDEISILSKEIDRMKDDLNIVIKKGKDYSKEYIEALNRIKQYYSMIEETSSENNKRKLYHYAQIFIEEPEQNLFPSAQKEVVEYLIKSVLRKEKMNNYLFVSTHSPYVLTALNNLILADNIGKKHFDKVNNLIPKDHWLPFENVNAFYVGNGKIKSIMEDEHKMIRTDELDEISDEVNELYYKLEDINN